MNRLLSKLRPLDRSTGPNANGVSHVRIVARDGHRAFRPAYVVTAAETAPCTCPEFCERDHANE